MPAIRITSVGRKCIAFEKDFKLLKQHLGEWLPITSVAFDDEDGSVLYYVVKVEHTVICVFLQDTVDYEIYKETNNEHLLS